MTGNDFVSTFRFDVSASPEHTEALQYGRHSDPPAETEPALPHTRNPQKQAERPSRKRAIQLTVAALTAIEVLGVQEPAAAQLISSGSAISDSGSDELEASAQTRGGEDSVEDSLPRRADVLQEARGKPSDKQERPFDSLPFDQLNLSRPLLKACSALGFQQSTPIQAACIPLALMGRDISGSAITGSGKTAAYGLPILDRLLYRSHSMPATYALILTPTRELAVQVHSMLQSLAKFTDIRVALVVGGLSFQVQASTLRSGPEVVVATPGRLIDHLRNTQSVDFGDLQILVLDEADRLLQMGFSAEVAEIVRLIPKQRQTFLFSATMTEEVQELAAVALQRPVRLAADPMCCMPSQLVQEIVQVKDVHLKEATLLALCARNITQGRTIVFFQTKLRAHRAKMLFQCCDLPSGGELHGDMTQASRLESLERFRKGEVSFLFATDVAARGLDILGVETVINFDAPTTIAGYLHRVGRTARAGQKGRAITLAEHGDKKLLKQVARSIKGSVHERTIPKSTIRAWAAKIEGSEADIKQLLKEEAEERQLRRAEMEIRKADNLIEHEAEIFSRPAKTWFTAPKQPADASDESLRAREQQEHQVTGKKRSRDTGEHTEEKEQPIAKHEVAPKKTRTQSRNPRSAPTKPSLKPKPRKQDKQITSAKQPSTPVSTRVYQGGRKSKAQAPSNQRREELKSRNHTGKGRTGFKSKARFKRK